MNFYQELLAGVFSTKREQLVWTWKLFQTTSIVLWTKQSIKSSTYISEGFCLNFKSTFTIFKEFMNDFWSDFRKTPHDDASFC